MGIFELSRRTRETSSNAQSIPARDVSGHRWHYRDGREIIFSQHSVARCNVDGAHSLAKIGFHVTTVCGLSHAPRPRPCNKWRNFLALLPRHSLCLNKDQRCVISGPKRLTTQRPCDRCALFQLCRKVFKASRLNLGWTINLSSWLGKSFLKVSLWKVVQTVQK
jgi:hypothetical protein